MYPDRGGEALQRTVLKSKIHRGTVTRADLDYEGSLSLDPELMRQADIIAGEQVHVVNVTNGSRALTYAIEGVAGEIGLNGAIAHLGSVGDIVIVLTYAQYEETELARHVPRVLRVDAENRVRAEVAAP
jgi:aspartate 1-decarboxylase